MSNNVNNQFKTELPDLAYEPSSEYSNSSNQIPQQSMARMTTGSPAAATSYWRTTISTSEQASTSCSRTETEKERSPEITLRSRTLNQPDSQSQSASINKLPKELSFPVFQQLPQKELLTPDGACIGFGGKVLNKESLQHWQAEGKKLREQTPQLRQDFEHSQQLIRQACYGTLGIDELRTSVSHFAGIDLNFSVICDKPELVNLLDYCHDQTIKLSAGGIGRKFFLSAVLPALSKIPAGCRVVLDASDNNLGPGDVRQLLNFMKANPCIVQLNLDGNPLCDSNKISSPIVELFHNPSPLSHLYLNHINLNSETASEISKPLATNPCLRHLDLRNNRLTEDAALDLIGAVATMDSTGEVHTNTVLAALRLQKNIYGNPNEKIFSAIEVAHRIVAKTRQDYVEHAVEYDYVVQVDGVTGGISQFKSMQDAYQNSFRNKAKAEKL
jgi:hypothetical protein